MKLQRRAGFTLIELMISIAIVAVLGVVAVTTLNPAELFKQARDATRLSDFATLSGAIGLAANEGVPLGSPSTVYVSIPDPAATSSLGSQCQGLGLPHLPSPWTYHCAASSTYKSVDGTGWLPLTFQGITGGSPVSALPVDPTNNTTSCMYYTYVTSGGGFEITSELESKKYAPEMAKGGAYDGLYEKGTVLDSTPPFRSYGLVGLWTLDEGSGSTAIDMSCSGNNGTWSGTPVGAGGTYYTTGKDWPKAGYFDSNSLDTVTVPLSGSLALGGNMSTMAWIYMPILYGGPVIDGLDNAHRNGYYLTISNRAVSYYVADGSMLSGAGTFNILNVSQWFHLAMTYSAADNLLTLYLNGNVVSTTTPSVTMGAAALGPVLGHYKNTGGYSNLIMNDVRIYNRTLTAAEIKAIYNAEK